MKQVTSLPHPLWRGQQVRDFEGLAAAAAGIKTYALMDRAGRSAFQQLQLRWPDAKDILVLCGHGNNGGDGYVLAALAKDAGLHVQVCHLGEPSTLTGDAATARNAWLVEQGVSHEVTLANYDVDVIVDGLIGTGLSGEVRAEYQQVIAAINGASCPVLALDVPSGLCADTGYVASVAVEADVTLSFVALKQGLFTGQAAQYCGEVVYDGLGIEQEFEQQGQTLVERVEYAQLSGLLKQRHKSGHKGQYGKVALAGGNLGMPGALRMAGEACQRSGAGIVKAITREENILAILSGRPELMVQSFNGHDWQLNDVLEWATTLVVGPGLGQDEWAKTLLTRFLDNPLPKVVDADALKLLVEMPQWHDNWILTPHSGEAAHMLGCSVDKVERDRFTAVRNIQQSFGGVVVLKGPGSLIYDGKTLLVANVGNPGMASGGMGDVLSGIIGGLLGQGLSLFDAAALGVCIHGQSADLAAQYGERGLLASDLLPFVRQLVNPKLD